MNFATGSFFFPKDESDLRMRERLFSLLQRLGELGRRVEDAWIIALRSGAKLTDCHTHENSAVGVYFSQRRTSILGWWLAATRATPAGIGANLGHQGGPTEASGWRSALQQVNRPARPAHPGQKTSSQGVPASLGRVKLNRIEGTSDKILKPLRSRR
jgi:hypothetical protein